MKMTQLLQIELNVNNYIKQFGILPESYILICSNIKTENIITITELDKYNAIKYYISISKLPLYITKQFNNNLFTITLI